PRRADERGVRGVDDVPADVESELVYTEAVEVHVAVGVGVRCRGLRVDLESEESEARLVRDRRAGANRDHHRGRGSGRRDVERGHEPAPREAVVADAGIAIAESEVD